MHVPSRSALSLAAAAVVLVALLLGPVPANALTLTAPTDVLGKVEAKAVMSSEETAGVLVLLLDERAVRSVVTSGGPRTVSFGQLPLYAGPHRLRAILRNASGLTQTERRDVFAWKQPVPPVLVSPSNGYGAKSTTILAKAGPGTTSLKLTLNGKFICTKSASPGQVVNMGVVTLVAGANKIVLQAANPVSSASGSFTVRRLDFPWSTCIVVDKSEFRLYWVKNGALVKTYPVAIGRPSLETPCRDWEVGAKYVYDVWGVYGPRRLRLFKEVGPGSFQYTGYGIHGTNEEWVIGTKASHGCIRMYNKDILELYPQVPMGTMVRTQE